MYIYIYIYIFIYIYIHIYYKLYFQQVNRLRVDNYAYLQCADFLEHVHIFFFITIASKQVETSKKLFTDFPGLVDQTTCHLHSSKLDYLKHLSRRLIILSMCLFLYRWKELNISETLIMNIKRLLEELHSIQVHFLDIV